MHGPIRIRLNYYFVKSASHLNYVAQFISYFAENTHCINNKDELANALS